MECEFCHTPSRKDYLAQHIRTKCANGVAKLLLKEWAEGMAVTPLKQYLDARPIQNIPIHSQLYDDVFYWFGVEPRVFDDEDEGWSKYTDNEENRKAHEAFLRECLSHLSVLDLIDVQRAVHIKSAEHTDLQRKYMALKKEVEEDKKETREELEARDLHIQRLTRELDDMRETMESSETIGELRQRLHQAEVMKASYGHRLEEVTSTLARIESEHDRQINDIYEAHRTRRQESEELYNKLFQQHQALKKENERLQLSIKKEAQKMLDKQEKERQKEKEKARKAKEKLKEEIALAKMKARRSTPKKKKKHVSSSSESSSDSDSSSDSSSDSD